MVRVEQLEGYTQDFLQGFLDKLSTHVRRSDARGRALPQVREIVKRFEVVAYEKTFVLKCAGWKPDSSKKAIEAINQHHLPFSFAPYEGAPDILVRRLERVKARRRDLHYFVPLASTADLRATVTRDPSYSGLMAYIKHVPLIGKVTLIQHSGAMSTPLVTDLLGKGADVRLLIQSHSDGLPESERARMGTEFAGMEKKYWLDGGSLRVFSYRSPSSVRAVLVHDVFVAVGWYNYFASEGGGYTIYGHNQPYLFAKVSDGSFRHLSEMVLGIADAVEAHCPLSLDLPRNRARAHAR